MGPGPKGVSYKIVNITKDSHPELDSMIQEEGWLFNHLHKLGLPADKIVR
jgi:glutaredoxin